MPDINSLNLRPYLGGALVLMNGSSINANALPFSPADGTTCAQIDPSLNFEVCNSVAKSLYCPKEVTVVEVKVYWVYHVMQIR